MTTVPTDVPAAGKRLRLWPGVAIVALQWLVRFGVPVVLPDYIEGKSWNHPVLVGDVLLTRNSQEMAAYRLALAGS